MKQGLIGVTAVQYLRDSSYGIQFKELQPSSIDEVQEYVKTRIIYLTESEFLSLTKKPLEEVRKMSMELLNI